MAFLTTLQLELPCKVGEANEWWAEVQRVLGDLEESDADVSITHGSDGRQRLQVHLVEVTTSG